MKNKKASGLYKLAGILFMLAATFSFLGQQSTNGTVFICLGVVFLALSRRTAEGD